MAAKSDKSKTSVDYFLLEVGTKIKLRREDLGLSMRSFSEGIGISYAYLSNIENGKVNPTLKELKTICEGLGLEIDIVLSHK